MTDDERAYLRRLVDERVEGSMRKNIQEEIDRKFETYFDTGDDPREVRRVKEGIRWAADRKESSQETWKTLLAEAVKLAVGAVVGAVGYWFTAGHGGGK